MSGENPMRFECPNCDKVMKVKDEYAGKTGKCPGCGRKVTLPDLDAPQPSSEAGQENDDILEAESAAFITDPDEAPHSLQWDDASETPEKQKPSNPLKWILSLCLLALIALGVLIFYVFSLRSPQVPGLSLYNVPTESYVKRSGALPEPVISSWQAAIKEATGEYVTDRQLFFKLPNLDGLWQEDRFVESTSVRYLARIRAVPVHAVRDWRTALRRAAGDGVGQDLSDSLLRMIEIDRLFVDEQFQNAASDLLISHLNALSSSDANRWAEALGAGTGQAALTLACMDPLFDKNGFDAKRFERALKARE